MIIYYYSVQASSMHQTLYREKCSNRLIDFPSFLVSHFPFPLIGTLYIVTYGFLTVKRKVCCILLYLRPLKRERRLSL